MEVYPPLNPHVVEYRNSLRFGQLTGRNSSAATLEHSVSSQTVDIRYLTRNLCIGMEETILVTRKTVQGSLCPLPHHSSNPDDSPYNDILCIESVFGAIASRPL
jgi:hypothetical protein